MICPAPAPRPRSSPARTTGLLSEGREVTTTDSRSGLPVYSVLVGEMVNLVVALTGDELITIDSKSTGENPGLSVDLDVVTLIGDDVTTIDSRSGVWPGFSVVVGLVVIVTIPGAEVITIASRSGVCPGLKVVVDTVVVLVVVTSTGDEVITIESRSGMVPGVAASQQLHELDVLVAVAAVVIVTTKTGGCFVVSSAAEVITMDSKSVSGFSVVFGDSSRLGGGEGFDVQRRQRTWSTLHAVMKPYFLKCSDLVPNISTQIGWRMQGRELSSVSLGTTHLTSSGSAQAP